MIFPYAALLVLCLSIVVKFDAIVSFFQNLSFPSLVRNDFDKTTLLVGVISAQANFRARNAIRETWGQLANNRAVEIKFVIGDEICPYPLEDRLTPYDCDLWLINLPKDLEEFSTIGRPIRSESCEIGFTFLVKTPIELRRIGLDYIAFFGNTTEKARVVLYNSKSNSKVASATFIKEPISGFFWKPVPLITLDEGFEGEIKVIGEGLQLSYCNKTLEYVASLHIFETQNSNGEYTKYKLGNFKSSIVGMNYTLKDVNGLEDILVKRTVRFDKWSLTMSLLKQQLEEEQNKYGDIIFLSGFIDVYDNLSFKVAVFLDWVKKFGHWSHILKTDDDVFVDLVLVEKGLEGSWDLWTCLQAQSPNPWGKWRDRNLTEYPLFPSGAGYVLSMEALKNLQLQPRTKLGEDVMIGFSLSELSLPLKEQCFWACGSSDPGNRPFCNVPELSPAEMKKLWDAYLKEGLIPDK